MPALPCGSVFQLLRRVVGRGEEKDATDGQLLRSFVATRDETAFELLVRRHGPMVLGVCRRVLGNLHDAEDAFQAVFLVLARKAASVTPPDLVGNWLHGVAYRTALEARSRAARRCAREKQVVNMPHPLTDAEPDWQELRPLLDQELVRLPEKYRAAVILCDLEGRSRTEAAAQLKVPVGTVSSRLTSARKLLAQRLTRRGVALSAGALAALLSEQAVQAAVPPTLLVAALRIVNPGAAGLPAISDEAVALADSVLRTMLMMKLKTLAAGAVLCCTLVAALGLAWTSTPGAEMGPAQPAAPPHQLADEPSAPAAGQPAEEPAAKEPAGKDRTRNGDLKPFARIHLKQGKAVIRQTGKEAVEARGDPPLRDMAETNVADGTLYLNAPHPDIEFVVDVKDLTHLRIAGVGKVEVMDLKGEKLEIQVDAAGQVSVSGSVQEQVIRLSAAGQFNGEGCKSKRAEVHVGSGGRAVVQVSDRLRAAISAGGTLEYVGSPQVEEDVKPGGVLRSRPAAEAKE